MNCTHYNTLYQATHITGLTKGKLVFRVSTLPTSALDDGIILNYKVL